MSDEGTDGPTFGDYDFVFPADQRWLEEGGPKVRRWRNAYSRLTPTACVTDAVELGVELLAHVEESMSVAEAVDRIETVTTDPATTRRILEEAERRGAIEREGTTVRPTSGAYVSFDSAVVQREGEFTCRRCGADISTGHFVRFDAGEHGPFGSTCIRTVLGRE